MLQQQSLHAWLWRVIPIHSRSECSKCNNKLIYFKMLCKETVLDLGDEEAIEWVGRGLGSLSWEGDWAELLTKSRPGNESSGVLVGAGNISRHCYEGMYNLGVRAILNVLSVCLNRYAKAERPRVGHSIQPGDSGRTSRGFVTPLHHGAQEKNRPDQPQTSPAPSPALLPLPLLPCNPSTKLISLFSTDFIPTGFICASLIRGHYI